MSNLLPDAGEFRKTEVRIVKGSKVQHLAPPGSMVKALMKDLFNYLKNSDELPLIKSCVFHYQVEFIHPFVDGNGRMGRLWQTMILMQHTPLFEFLPIESIIKQKQQHYYEALSRSDKTGKATFFIEFMLTVIEESLEILLKSQHMTLTGTDRIMLFKDIVGTREFSRQDYLRHFKEIASATASRDLKRGVDEGILKKEGDKRMTKYRYVF